MSMDDNDPEVRRVRLQVRAFRHHLTTYLAVVGMLFLINLFTGGFWGGHWWFLWVAVFWGIFVAMEAMRIFGHDVGRDWEDKMVDQVMARRRGEAPKQEPSSGPSPTSTQSSSKPASTWTPPQPPRPSPPASS